MDALLSLLLMLGLFVVVIGGLQAGLVVLKLLVSAISPEAHVRAVTTP